MARKYHILTGILHGSDKHEIIFGDYDRDCVKDEAALYRDHARELAPLDDDSRGLVYVHLVVRTMPDDRQATIDAELARLNA